MGTVAISVVKNDVSGNQRVVTADVTFSASYATGGDTVTLASLGLGRVEAAYVESGVLPKAGTVVPSGSHTPATHGLQAVLAGTQVAPLLKAVAGTAGTPAEVANTTNLSAVPVVRIEFRGR